MNTDILFEILKLVVIIATAVVTRYVVPYLKEKIGAEKLAAIENEVRTLVLAVQQLYPNKTGDERLYIVTQETSKFLNEKGIELTADQIRYLIESAVKEMKLAGGAAA